MQVLWGIGGMLLLLAIAFALSKNRRAIRLRTVLGALAIQIIFAFIVLSWNTGEQILSAVSNGVQAVIDSSKEGIDFMVGPIMPSKGTVFAFQVLPIIVFVASLTAVLYHLRILQWVVRIIGGGLQKALGTSRAESLNATANIFLGQTEAPLVIRPYLQRMTQSEFFAVMVGGLSTVAGTVLVGYAMLGARLEHLIAASFMAAPAALMFAKIIMPETERPVTSTASAVDTTRSLSSDESGAESSTKSTTESTTESEDDNDTSAKKDDTNSADNYDENKPRNVVDAAARGAGDGLRLALNVAATLFAFISLVALLNLLLGTVGGWFGAPELSMQQILGYIFSPVVFAIGVPWNEAVQAASFVGEKLVLNEFVAFSDFAPQAGEFSSKTATIVTFALTGFANISSLAILLGGLGGLVPSRRGEIAKYGGHAILAGTLANLMSAAIAGIVVG